MSAALPFLHLEPSICVQGVPATAKIVVTVLFSSGQSGTLVSVILGFNITI